MFLVKIILLFLVGVVISPQNIENLQYQINSKVDEMIILIGEQVTKFERDYQNSLKVDIEDYLDNNAEFFMMFTGTYNRFFTSFLYEQIRKYNETFNSQEIYKHFNDYTPPKRTGLITFLMIDDLLRYSVLDTRFEMHKRREIIKNIFIKSKTTNDYSQNHITRWFANQRRFSTKFNNFSKEDLEKLNEKSRKAVSEISKLEVQIEHLLNILKNENEKDKENGKKNHHKSRLLKKDRALKILKLKDLVQINSLESSKPMDFDFNDTSPNDIQYERELKTDNPQTSKQLTRSPFKTNFKQFKDGDVTFINDLTDFSLENNNPKRMKSGDFYKEDAVSKKEDPETKSYEFDLMELSNLQSETEYLKFFE